MVIFYERLLPFCICLFISRSSRKLVVCNFSIFPSNTAVQKGVGIPVWDREILPCPDRCCVREKLVAVCLPIVACSYLLGNVHWILNIFPLDLKEKKKKKKAAACHAISEELNGLAPSSVLDAKAPSPVFPCSFCSCTERCSPSSDTTGQSICICTH